MRVAVIVPYCQAKTLKTLPRTEAEARNANGPGVFVGPFGVKLLEPQLWLVLADHVSADGC